MPEVGPDDPAVVAGNFVRLFPCSTLESGNTGVSHVYEAQRFVAGVLAKKIGWLSLDKALEIYAAEPYRIVRSSHGLCPDCFLRINGIMPPDSLEI